MNFRFRSSILMFFIFLFDFQEYATITSTRKFRLHHVDDEFDWMMFLTFFSSNIYFWCSNIPNLSGKSPSFSFSTWHCLWNYCILVPIYNTKLPHQVFEFLFSFKSNNDINFSYFINCEKWLMRSLIVFYIFFFFLAFC